MDVMIDTDQDAQASWHEQGFEVYTTEQLLELLQSGHQIVLPDVDPSVLDLPVGDGIDPASLSGEDNPIVSIECIGEEDVQCISVDDPDHLYLTDYLIPTHNTANIVFLKSTDDSMIETLSKMSGTTHETHRDSKMITRDEQQPLLQNASTISYTISTQERPVITYNDLAYLPERNSIMFIASNPCVWNRNETILPMSWRLYGNHTIKQPGHDYTLQTIPTLSSAVDFDVRANQPNFGEMLEQRLREARYVQRAKDMYKEVYQYDDDDIARLDEDVYSDAIMDIVDDMIMRDEGVTTKSQVDTKLTSAATAAAATSSVNTDVMAEREKADAQQKAWQKRYLGGGMCSRDDFCSIDGTVNGQLKDAVAMAYKQAAGPSAYTRGMEKVLKVRRDGGLNGADPFCKFIYVPKGDSADAKRASEAATNKDERVYTEGYLSSNELMHKYSGFEVSDEFMRFLAGYGDYSNMPWADGNTDWTLANGEFAKALHKVMTRLGS